MQLFLGLFTHLLQHYYTGLGFLSHSAGCSNRVKLVASKGCVCSLFYCWYAAQFPSDSYVFNKKLLHLSKCNVWENWYVDF